MSEEGQCEAVELAPESEIQDVNGGLHEWWFYFTDNRHEINRNRGGNRNQHNMNSSQQEEVAKLEVSCTQTHLPGGHHRSHLPVGARVRKTNAIRIPGGRVLPSSAVFRVSLRSQEVDEPEEPSLRPAESVRHGPSCQPERLSPQGICMTDKNHAPVVPWLGEE